MGGYYCLLDVAVFVVVVTVVVEASVPKAYPRVTLASASDLSWPVVRTLRVGSDFQICFALLHRAWAAL